MSLTASRVGGGSSLGIGCRGMGGKHGVVNFAFAIRRGPGTGASMIDGRHSTDATSVFAISKLGSGRLKHVTHGPTFVTRCGRLMDPADLTKRSRRK